MSNQIFGPQLLGPLTPLVGEWEGNVGVDLSYHNNDKRTAETGYFEKAWFKPIPTQQNGRQFLEGLKYGSVAWRHGEESMNPFHDEIGYLLWDKERSKILRTVVFGRGIAIQAGADAKIGDRVFTFKADCEHRCYGILQNEYLLERAELISFESTFKFNDDGSLTHSSDIVMRMDELGGEKMNHTDVNTLKKVKNYHPSIHPEQYL